KSKAILRRSGRNPSDDETQTLEIFRELPIVPFAAPPHLPKYLASPPRSPSRSSPLFFSFFLFDFFRFFFFGVGCRKDRRFPRNGFFFRDFSCWVLICSGLTPVSCSGIRVSSGSHLSSRSPTVIAPAEPIPRLVLSPACLSLGKINLFGARVRVLVLLCVCFRN
ncbi:hypothetical protein B296_00021156, partial [Ensete ventricosum]